MAMEGVAGDQEMGGEQRLPTRLLPGSFLTPPCLSRLFSKHWVGADA